MRFLTTFQLHSVKFFGTLPACFPGVNASVAGKSRSQKLLDATHTSSYSQFYAIFADLTLTCAFNKLAITGYLTRLTNNYRNYGSRIQQDW
jgi:hypothetical protein